MVISKAEKCDKSGKSRKYPTFKNNLLRSQVVISCKCSCQLVSHFGFSRQKVSRVHFALAFSGLATYKRKGQTKVTTAYKRKAEKGGGGEKDY